MLTALSKPPEMIEVLELRQLTKPRRFPVTWRAIAVKQWRLLVERSQSRAPSRSPIRSAKRYGLGETSLAGFLVLAVHVFRGLGQSHHGGVEIDPVPGCDLVAGDRESSPGLDCTECASLNARNLYVTGARVAGHAQVMLQSRFGSILDHPRFCIVGSSDQGRSH